MRHVLVSLSGKPKRVIAEADGRVVRRDNDRVMIGVAEDWYRIAHLRKPSSPVRRRPQLALESLHVNEAREAFVRGARGPLAVGLHQGSHEFSTPFRSGGAGCPLLMPQPPHASACRGERPYWWEQAQGLNSRSGEPLSRDRTPTEAAPRTASLFLLRFTARSRWPDGSNAASPLNCCRGGVGGYSSSVNLAGISRSGPCSSS
jgi:hypothetical protein